MPKRFGFQARPLGYICGSFDVRHLVLPDELKPVSSNWSGCKPLACELSHIREIIDVDVRTLYWLAGILEGEGSFCAGPPSRPYSCVISMSTTDRDVASRVAHLFDITYQTIKPRQAHHKVAYAVKLRGRRAARFMHQLWPLMSQRRREQIDNALIVQSTRHRSYKLTLDEENKVRQAAGTVTEICKKFAISPATYYRIQAR